MYIYALYSIYIYICCRGQNSPSARRQLSISVGRQMARNNRLVIFC